MENNYAHLKETVLPGVFTQWQEVDVEIYAFTDLGVKVAIDDEYTGLIYGNEMYGDYHEGQKLKAYIKLVRTDGRIDVSLQPQQGRHVFQRLTKSLNILRQLAENPGLTMEVPLKIYEMSST